MGIKDKIYGCLFGQAIGDALGLGTEFMTKTEAKEKYPNGLTEYSQIIRDYHRIKFQPGMWSDDTDMMLCIANAIIEDKGINLHTIARNFKDWFYAPDTQGVGQTTYKVLAIADYVEKAGGRTDMEDVAHKECCQWCCDENFDNRATEEQCGTDCRGCLQADPF